MLAIKSEDLLEDGLFVPEAAWPCSRHHLQTGLPCQLVKVPVPVNGPHPATRVGFEHGRFAWHHIWRTQLSCRFAQFLYNVNGIAPVSHGAIAFPWIGESQALGYDLES